MNQLEVVSWFDDRFYPALLKNAIVKKLVKKMWPYEPTVVPKDKNYSRIFLPSSTSILSSSPKDWLAVWRGQVGNWEANRVMDEARVKGKNIHHAFALYQQDHTIIYNNPEAPAYKPEKIDELRKEPNGLVIVEDQQTMLELWRLSKLFEIFKPKVVGVEMTVINTTEGYAGTLDDLWFMEADDYDFGDKVKFTVPETGNYILDVKTGKNEDSDNYPEQLASYKHAAQEEGIDIKGGIIIYTNAKTKKGIEGLKLDFYTAKDLDYHYAGFLHQYEVWKKKVHISPKVFDLPSLLRRTN